MKRITFVGIVMVCMLACVAMANRAQAAPITFAPGQYDNTANTVTGTNASPVYNNNQTTGDFRDIFWWGTAFNGGTAGVGSPDYINSGKNLISSGGSPAHATPGGLYDALNFTGQRTAGGASFLTVYDTTPGDGTATKNLFSAVGGLEISGDVLFTPGGHNASGGLVALYAEGQDGLALLLNNGGGNNPDVPKVSLVFSQGAQQTANQPITLASQSLTGGTIAADNWYRVVMDLSVTGDSFNITGKFYNHLTGTDPTSALGSLITTLNYSGSLLDPDASLRILTNPGEIGLMAYTPENFNDGLRIGGTGADPGNDNVGVSITNFDFPQQVPEPTTLLLLGSGLVGLAGFRRKFKK